MSTGPISTIAEHDLEFVAVPSDFTGLLAGELGNLGTDHDGFESAFAEAADLAASASATLESFDGDLTDMGVAVPQADSSSATAQLAELQPAAVAIDASLHDYTSLNPVPVPDAGGGGTAPPPPPPPGPPPSSYLGTRNTASTPPNSGDPGITTQIVPTAGQAGRPVQGELSGFALGSPGPVDSITCVAFYGNDANMATWQFIDALEPDLKTTYKALLVTPHASTPSGDKGMQIAVQVNGQATWYNAYIFVML